MSQRSWLTLALTDGIGPLIGRRLIGVAGSAESAAGADVALLRTVPGIGLNKAGTIARKLAEARAKVDDALAEADALGLVILSPDDDAFPPMLAMVPDAPLVLYSSSCPQPRDLNSIAIVGSRKCSIYGREQAERFGALLAGAGFTVVSGGARGIDSAAHRGAMSPTQGRTIAVLGCGSDVVYPPENRELFEKIRARGLVMTEYPPGFGPRPENFPRRNRIVAAMSRGVVVVEADERSGALITARLAVEEYGRPVMALPGRVDNPLSAGPHKLIRDGATLVTRIEHVTEAIGRLDAALPEVSLFDDPLARPVEYDDGSNVSAGPGRSDGSDGTGSSRGVSESSGESRFSGTNAPDVAGGATPPVVLPVLVGDQAKIFNVIEPGGVDIDTLVSETGLEVAVVLRELTFLTLKGRVVRQDGQRFARR